MAKKPATSTNDKDVKIPEVDMATVLNSGIKFTMNEAIRLVASQFVEVPNFHSLHQNGYHRDGMLLLIGEAGISKTTQLKHLAAVNDIDFSTLEFAGTEVADNLGMSTPIEDPENKGQYLRLNFGKIYQKPKGKRGLGMTLVNEALGGDPRQQQQFRAFLSNRSLAGSDLDPGHILVGDSNPANSRYFTNRGLDFSLQSRLFFIPVEDEFDEAMRFYAGNNTQDDIIIPEVGKPVKITRNGFHETLYFFLRKTGGGTHGYFKIGNRRRWSMISTFITRMESSGLVDAKLLGKFLSIAMPAAVVNDYGNFTARGDDPKFYPIRGDHFFEADKPTHDGHMKLLKGWMENTDLNIMTGFTVTEFIDYLRGMTKMTATQMKYMTDVVNTIEVTQTLQIIRGATYNGTVMTQLFETTKGTKAERELYELTNPNSR